MAIYLRFPVYSACSESRGTSENCGKGKLAEEAAFSKNEKQEEGKPYHAKLIFASSRVAPMRQPLSVPRKELNSLVLGCRKVKELAKELSILPENLTLHSDSIVCMYWAMKSSSKLSACVWNRCKILKEAGIEILRTASDTNPADPTSKIKSVSAYINNPFWEEGPGYLKDKDEDWRKWRTIEEIKATHAPSVGEQEEIEKELRSREAIARINYVCVT